MVPLDFHKYRREIARALFAQKDSLLTEEWDAFVAAWVAYALSKNGFQNNLPLEELANRLERRAAQDSSWEWQRNLGPLAFYCWLREHMGKPQDASITLRLSETVKCLNEDDKLSLLKDAEEVFLLALGLRNIEEVRAKLVAVAMAQMDKGPLKRRVLYVAALREMGENRPVPQMDPQDPGDVIALVWCAERYPGELRRDGEWQRFGNLVETISLDKDEARESQRVLSVSELALLYEAVTREASQPDPMLLFHYYPLHPWVRQIAHDHFCNGKYVVAVEQSCKVLNELIQSKSGVNDKSEAELVQSTMKNISNPKYLTIRFNEFLNEDSGRNEQAGLALICEGVFKAFRNPKVHKPDDHPLVQLDPYEALAQLVTISYLMVRIEKSKGGEDEI